MVVKSRTMRWVRNVARSRVKRNTYIIILVGNQENRPPGRPKNRWKDIILVDLT